MVTQQFHIEKHVHGGFGLSHSLDGKVTLLEGVIAGETVTAKIYSQSKNLQKGRATQIIEQSPFRIQAPCKYYKQCGGCDFQHMTYPRQLQAKEEVIRDLLLRSGHKALSRAAENSITPLPASNNVFHYRQRIRLQVDGRQTPGFYKRRSNDCIAIDTCMLAQEEINDCLKTLLQQQTFLKLLKRTEAIELLLNPAGKKVTLLFHLSQKPRPADRQRAEFLVEECREIEHIFFHGSDFAPTGKAVLSFSIDSQGKELSLSWESGGFCQVNLHQNQKLIQTVLEYCDPAETDSVLDLFCGMGNFSIPLAQRAKTLTGIEGQGSAIRSAKANSNNAGQSNTHFFKRAVHDACTEMIKNGNRYDVVVIDPPRAGAPDLSSQLAQLTKKRLIYISCDPATLCRDLASLLDKGFRLIKLQPIDMFPQTHHIECVALLELVPENH